MAPDLMSEPRSIFPVEDAIEEEMQYFRMIDEALQNPEDRVISNGMPAHAVYLLYKFLERAQEIVRIYTGRLSQSFNGVLAYADPKLAEAAIGFLAKPGTKLSIVIVDDPDIDDGQSIEDHPLLSSIATGDVQGEVKVSKGDPKQLDSFKYHFIVMDNQAVRIEFDTDAAKAYVNFRDQDFGKDLVSLFDSVEADSQLLFSVPKAA